MGYLYFTQVQKKVVQSACMMHSSPLTESPVERTSLTPGARVSCGTVARQRMRGVVACPPVFTRIRFTRKQL